MLPTLEIFGVTSLPVELLRMLCSVADRSALFALALSNRTLNEIATPMLYSTIDLNVFHATYACARTLALSPEETSMHRDFAGFVETISLHDPNLWFFKSSRSRAKRSTAIARRLMHAIPRMRRLRSFTCRMYIFQPLDIFLTLVSGPLPHVDSIDVTVSFPSRLSTEQEVRDPLPVAVRGLKSLKLRWSHKPATRYEAYICSMLAASRDTLQTLSLPWYGFTDHFYSVLRSIPSFSNLRELEVTAKLLREPAFRDAPSIRHLIIITHDRWDEGRPTVEIAPSAFPNLEAVTCVTSQLAAFLPDTAEDRRPIKKVTLNYASSERIRTGVNYHLGADKRESHWSRSICPALSALEFSGARLVHLSLTATKLCVSSLLELSPLLTELEFLFIMLERPPGEGSGGDHIFAMARVLDRMPRLHTLLLSDAVALYHTGLFPFAHDEDYQRDALAVYDEYSSSLRRVAFTSHFEWEKRVDGWHAWGHVVDEREVVPDGEDDSPWR